MVGGDENDDQTLSMIIKGPDYGTVESLHMLISKVISEHVQDDLEIKIISSSVGSITLQDIKGDIY